LYSECKWGTGTSFWFHMTSGVRQGGILSPKIFALYVDDLILILRRAHIGCHLLNLFLSCIFYADDLALLSPTRSSMQCLVDICVEYGDMFCNTADH